MSVRQQPDFEIPLESCKRIPFVKSIRIPFFFMKALTPASHQAEVYPLPVYSELAGLL